MELSRYIAVVAAIISMASQANAQCYGSGSFRTCYDRQSGNSYDIQNFGGSTYMSGRNSGTGSRWSQETHRFGNMSSTTGRDSQGNSWSADTTTIGDTTYTSGRDSNGNYFSQTCNSYGCY